MSIPISQPHLTKEDNLEINRCFASSWISSKSPWVGEFEKTFAKKVSKTSYAIATNSGTSALFLALKALGIGPEDEVIVPTFTMIATVNAVVWAGARPVLVDCTSKNDWNINSDDIEKKITKRTKAIIPVHIYGYVCQMDKIRRIAEKNKLFIIEDAAEAMGSVYQGKNAGSFSDAACFSLYANKIITTGNGGVIATNNRRIYQMIKRISFFDFNRKGHFNHELIGYNMVLSGLQAALGTSQLERFDKLLSKRRKIFELYFKNLKFYRQAHFIISNKDQQPNYWFPALVFLNKKIRNKVAKVLEEKQIETRLFFKPIHQQIAYEQIADNKKFPIADYFYERGLLLPSFYDLEEKQIMRISSIIKKTPSFNPK